MAYVSARYAPPEPTMPMMPGASKVVIATDDQGIEWWLTEDCDVGDWKEFLASGGTVEPYQDEPASNPAPE